MSEMIRDGIGTGNLLRIDNKNRVRGYVVIEDESSFVNRVEGESYSGGWGNSGLKAGTAGNFIAYLRNTGSKVLVIVRVRHRCEDANGSLSFWLGVDGTPGGTLTTLTPANRNAGLNNTADCVYYTSSEITGLTNGRNVGGIYGKAGEEFEFIEPCSGYILPPGTTFAIKTDNNTTTHFGGISMYFRDQDIG